MAGDTRRIQKEIRQVLADKEARLSVELVGDSFNHLRGTIYGPADTPYAGGTFYIDIQMPHDYPFKPPKMKFLTKLYHPNISSQTGAICLDILKDEWSPVLTLKTVLLSLQALLCDPVPDNPQDAEVAKHYMSNRPDYERTAKEWTRKYALESQPDILELGLDQASITRLCEMGFARPTVVKALRSHNGNEERAVESLLG
ncbi:ubiquitin-conjugating enzyme/RWD-like protein [Gaertneriomyces semiglobifer]|nr:ubiquitin-conjugating enzyme/RWD-like protein [Gaertneriomyces semiglobifer]